MSFEIPTLRIGDFADVKGGKRMPAGTALTSKKTSHPYLRIVDFKDGAIDASDLLYVPESVFPQISRYVISSEDIYISIVGTVGLVGSVPISLNGANLTENAAKICSIDSAKVNSRYLTYYLRSEAGQRAINSLTVGSTQPKLALFRIEQIEIPVPSLNVQHEIAATLGALDDRITLLRETNATLEAIAQALFKSWFVDFDPVRAKMEGRAPEGMDEATAALFPDSLEETELGVVPRGWGAVRLDSRLELAYGKALKAENRKSGDVPVYGSGGITGWHDTALVHQPSVIVGRKGTVGSVYWESRPFFPIDTVFYVRTKYPLTYCHQLLKTLGLHNMNTDAAVPGLNRENVYRLLVPDAPSEILVAFDTTAHAIQRRIDHNEAQAQTLSTLRDTLLPRLISGQLRVAEAQTAVEKNFA